MKKNDFLSKPNAGWSRFKYNKDMRISYIDDMPTFVLNNIIECIEKKGPFIATFDAEGYDYTIISYDRFDVECIMRMEDNPTIERLPYSFIEFVTLFIESIEENIEEWAIFPASVEFENKNIEILKEENKEKLLKLIQKVREVLPYTHKYD